LRTPHPVHRLMANLPNRLDEPLAAAPTIGQHIAHPEAVFDRPFHHRYRNPSFRAHLDAPLIIAKTVFSCGFRGFLSVWCRGNLVYSRGAKLKF
jgi:hypothetical protein